jgi:hypothetical protein
MVQHRSDAIDLLPRGTNLEFYPSSARRERFCGFTLSIAERVLIFYEMGQYGFLQNFTILGK